MTKFKKKPVLVDAYTFDEVYDMYIATNDNKLEINGRFIFYNKEDHTFTIETLEGDMKMTQDDVMIKGINGECYPCKIDIFEKTYSKVETGPIKVEFEDITITVDIPVWTSETNDFNIDFEAYAIRQAYREIFKMKLEEHDNDLSILIWNLCRALGYEAKIIKDPTHDSIYFDTKNNGSEHFKTEDKVIIKKIAMLNNLTIEFNYDDNVQWIYVMKNELNDEI